MQCFILFIKCEKCIIIFKYYCALQQKEYICVIQLKSWYYAFTNSIQIHMGAVAPRYALMFLDQRMHSRVKQCFKITNSCKSLIMYKVETERNKPGTNSRIWALRPRHLEHWIIALNYYGRVLFFQGPIGRDIKTTVKIRNILFATFSHTYQLLLYIVAAPTQIFFVAWYQLPYTLVIEASRLCFQPILYSRLLLIVPKYCPLTTISYEERDGNHREPSPGG